MCLWYVSETEQCLKDNTPEDDNHQFCESHYECDKYFSLVDLFEEWYYVNTDDDLLKSMDYIS